MPVDWDGGGCIVLSHRRGKAQTADTGGSGFISLSLLYEEERTAGPKAETHWPLLVGLKTGINLPPASKGNSQSVKCQNISGRTKTQHL